jgi:hypothetical protein
VTADGSWRQYTLTSTAPSGTATVRYFPFMTTAGATAGYALIDVCTLIQMAVDLGYATGFSTDEFTINNASLVLNSIAASKLYVGSVLRVGGGSGTYAASFGGAANGQIAVYNAENELRAWMGEQGSYFGVWAGEFRAGGTDPSSALIYMNSAGSSYIKGTTFVLELHGVRVAIENTVDSVYGAYAGVIVQNISTVQRTIVTAGGLACIGTNGCVAVTEYGDGAAGGLVAACRPDGTAVAILDGRNQQIRVYGSTGTAVSVLLDGNTESVKATRYFDGSGLQVLGARQTGWGAYTPADRMVGHLVSSTATAAQCAQVANAIIDFLMVHGAFGA